MDPIEEFIANLRKYTYSLDEIQKRIDCLRYLYMAQGGTGKNEHWIMDDEFREGVADLSQIKEKYIINNRCSPKGKEIGKRALEDEITKNKNKILDILKSLPKTILFYWVLWKIEPLSPIEDDDKEASQYFKEIKFDYDISPYMYDALYKHIVEPEEIRIAIVERVWNLLMNLNLIVT